MPTRYFSTVYARTRARALAHSRESNYIRDWWREGMGVDTCARPVGSMTLESRWHLFPGKKVLQFFDFFFSFVPPSDATVHSWTSEISRIKRITRQVVLTKRQPTIPPRGAAGASNRERRARNSNGSRRFHLPLLWMRKSSGRFVRNASIYLTDPSSYARNLQRGRNINGFLNNRERMVSRSVGSNVGFFASKVESRAPIAASFRSAQILRRRPLQRLRSYNVEQQSLAVDTPMYQTFHTLLSGADRGFYPENFPSPILCRVRRKDLVSYEYVILLALRVS